MTVTKKRKPAVRTAQHRPATRTGSAYRLCGTNHAEPRAKLSQCDSTEHIVEQHY